MITGNRDTGDANVIPLEHDGMLFCAYLSAIANGEDFIGAYVDCNGFPRRVRRTSLYGELVMAAVEHRVHPTNDGHAKSNDESKPAVISG